MRQQYQKRSDAALDKLVVKHINNGGSVDDALDLLDMGGVQWWICPLCDAFGSEDEKHDSACPAKSIAKRKWEA